METGLVIVLALAALVVVLAVKGVKIVQQSETMIVERLGRFHRALNSGVNIIWPIIDQPRSIEWKHMGEVGGQRVLLRRRIEKIDLRETVFDFPKQNVITKDNVVTELNALLYFQVIDPVKAVYEIANLPDAIEKLTQTSLRNIIGDMELDDVLTSRDVINKRLQEILDEASEKWGVKVNRVELQDINPPEDIKIAMEKQMRAERDRRAAILEAEGLKKAQVLKSEGERQSAVNRAEGEKTAQIEIAEGQAKARVLVAEAEAEAIRQVSQALQSAKADPAQYLVALRYLETLREVAGGQSAKVVFLPYEAASVLGAAGALKEIFAAADQRP